MTWKEYQEKTFRTKPNYLAVYLANNTEFSSIIDLGCGSGNETVYMLKKGKKVLAVDLFLNEDYILSRIKKEHLSNLTMVKASIEEVKLPPSDAIISTFVLPFCKKDKFLSLWNRINCSLNENGLIAANFFGERDHHKEAGILTFTKEEVQNLLENFEIIKWKEQEYTRKSDNTHWHYYDFVAKKKTN